MADKSINGMKTQLNETESRAYRLLLWRIKCRLSQFYGSQKQAAKELGIDETQLSKILSGTVDCNCKLFFRLLNYSRLEISANVLLMGSV